MISSITTSVASNAIGGTVAGFIGGPAGGLAGGALAGLLTAVADIPAAQRHKEKTEQAYEDILAKLRFEVDSLRKMTDDQFKIVNSSLLSLSETVDSKKIEYLKNVVLSAVKYDDYANYESTLITRIIRDISSEEIKFLVENFTYKSIHIYSWYKRTETSAKDDEDLRKLSKKISDENGLLILPGQTESLIVNGLVNLGVLVPGELSLGVHKYFFADIAVKLIVLLTTDKVR